MARPKQPILSRDGIRDQALAIIDQDGLAGLSMRRLADDLGVQAASLYSHYANKDAVLDAIATLLGEHIDTSGFDESWQDGIRTWAISFHGIMRQHPHAASLVAAGARSRPDYLDLAARVRSGLTRHGWPAREARMVGISASYFVLGAATTPFGSGFADDTAVYLDRYPNLSQAHLISEVAEGIDRESFALGLESLIDGLEPVRLGLVPAVGGPTS